MNLNQLAIFHAVAKSGNLTRASETLCISQPAVSKQLHTLEKSLGTALFHRLSKGVQLTESGLLLLEYSTRIFALETEAEQALSELRELQRGKLVIGASTTIGIYLLPQVMGEFQKLHPRVELQLEIGNTAQIQQELIANKIDLALTEGILEGAQWQSEACLRDEIIAVVAPSHALAKRSTPAISRLQNQQILLREIGSGTRKVVEAAFQGKAIPLESAMSLGNTEAIKRAVISGMGIAFVSRLAVADELKSGELVTVKFADWKIEREFYRLRLKGNYESRAAREFMHLLKQVSAPHALTIAAYNSEYSRAEASHEKSH